MTLLDEVTEYKNRQIEKRKAQERERQKRKDRQEDDRYFQRLRERSECIVSSFHAKIRDNFVYDGSRLMKA